MATYTDNYQLTKPTYAEQADIGVINSNMNKIDDIMHSSQVSLAPAYDQSQTYAEGDVVMYELLMYKCISPTTGVWDASKWERTTASESGGGGSAELDILGEASGAVASFADGASAELAKCIVEIVPKQDLHGYDKPWAGGVGKNKFNIDENRIGINYDDSSSLSRFWQTVSLPNGNYTISFNGNMTGISEISFGKADSMLPFSSINQHVLRSVMSSSNTALTVTIDASYPFAFIGVIKSGGSITNADIENLQIQIETGNTATAYEPYSNICPISGHTDVTVTVASTSGGSGEDTTVSLGRTVYKGWVNLSTGEGAITGASIDLGTLSWTYYTLGTNPIFYASVVGAKIYNNNDTVYDLCENYSNYGLASTRTTLATNLSNGEFSFISGGTNVVIRDDNYTSASDFTTAMDGVMLVNELATPQTFTLTKEQIQTLLGQNNISADTGDVDIVYVKASAPIQPNPTGTPTATLKKLGIEGTVFEVPSGGGGSSSGINYSTTEQVIGTWIDGKTLYQKNIILMNVSESAQIDISALTPETVFLAEGFVHLSGGTNLGLNEYLSNINYSYCHVYGQKIDCRLAGYTGDFNIVLKYTKITD